MSPCSTAETAACPLNKRIDAADPFVQISLPVMSFYTNLGSYTSNGLGVFSDHRKSLPIGPSCKWGTRLLKRLRPVKSHQSRHANFRCSACTLNGMRCASGCMVVPDL